MSRGKPTRKQRRRERRAAARHGLTIERYREVGPFTAAKRRRSRDLDPVEAWEAWREGVQDGC